MPELWDAYTNNGNLVKGVTLIRGETVSDGLNHLVCDILVQHEDGTYLVTQRHPNKSHGNMREASCGGSALQNEQPEVCALRELYEETGISPDTIKEVGHFVDSSCHCLFYEYIATTSINKKKVRLQEGETVDYKWLSKEELFAFQKNKICTKRLGTFFS